MRPLDGITVVTLEHAIAAPFCTRQLADLGARVIKVERPGSGDFARAYDARVKRPGVALRLDQPLEGKPDARRQARRAPARSSAGCSRSADVLVQNLAPGAAARLGLSFEALHETHPRLDRLRHLGLRRRPERPGPYRDKKAYDLLIQSESGFLSITGTPDEPAKAGCSIADIAAGMYAYSNILAALIERGRTGTGWRIDVSMLESMVEWMSYPLYYAFDGAAPPPRAGAAHATIYPYGPFPAGDGKTVMLGLQNEREWAGVLRARAASSPELATDPRFASNTARTAARDALRAIIVDAFATLTAEQVVARLDAAQIANARVNTCTTSGRIRSCRRAGAGPRSRRRPARCRRCCRRARATRDDARMDAVPALGEHTDAILAELGLDAAAIARLRRDGAI